LPGQALDCAYGHPRLAFEPGVERHARSQLPIVSNGDRPFPAPIFPWNPKLAY
jgi:hypothetical protein